MKKCTLAILFICSVLANLHAQNKTLGVGTTTLNPNAVLQVDAPTGNQGLLLPRLTTAQRTAMAVNTADIGLQLYDTDLKAVFVWDGTTWKNGGLTLPIAGSVSATTSALDVTNTGAGSVANFAISNTATSQPALVVTSNSNTLNAPGSAAKVEALGGGRGLTVEINNATNDSRAFSATTAGTGKAGQFESTNPASTNPTLYVVANGSSAVYATTNSNLGGTFYPVAVYGQSTGTGSGAAAFRNSNTSNNLTTVYSEANGTGTAIMGNNIGTSGSGGYFQITQAGNTSPALATSTTGTGPAANFSINNSASIAPAFFAGTNGLHEAGVFNINNVANNYPALNATTNGTGAAIVANITNGYAAVDAKNSGTTGSALFGHIENAAHNGAGVTATTIGTGPAGYFSINNPSSTNVAIFATTNSTDAAILGESSTSGAVIRGRQSNSTGIKNAIFGIHDGAGQGHAGLFQNTNAANNYPALQAEVFGTGAAMQVSHNGASGDIALFSNNFVAAARIDKAGKGFFNGGTQTGGADLAELFDVEGSKNEYEPGDVLIISEATDRTIEKSNTAYSTKVAGVYATKPGVTLTEKDINESMDELVPMGVIGVIPTKVCSENGPIKRGDLLVTSSLKGHAMKAVSKNGDGMFPAGVIIGKALENFEVGESGVIKVLVNVK